MINFILTSCKHHCSPQILTRFCLQHKFLRFLHFQNFGLVSICEPKFWGGSLFQNFWPKSKVTSWGIPKNIKKSGVFGQKPAFLEPSIILPIFFSKMTSFCFCSHSVNFCPISFRKDSLEAERQMPIGPLKQKNLRSTENWGQHPEHETFRALYLFSGPLGFFGWLIRGF